MYDPFKKQVKAHRTLGSAFGGVDYACAVEKSQAQPLPWWAVPLWVCILFLVVVAALVIAHFGG